MTGNDACFAARSVTTDLVRWQPINAPNDCNYVDIVVGDQQILMRTDPDLPESEFQMEPLAAFLVHCPHFPGSTGGEFRFPRGYSVGWFKALNTPGKVTCFFTR